MGRHGRERKGRAEKGKVKTATRARQRGGEEATGREKGKSTVVM